MCFLTLVAHLLSVLALGGLASGEDIPSENLQRSYNDEVYDLSEETAVNNPSSPEHLVRVNLSESQSTTVSSSQTTPGELFLPFPIENGRLNSTADENRFPTTRQTDNINSVTAEQLNDETDVTVFNEPTKAAGDRRETTEFFPVTSTPSKIIRNQLKQADSGTAIKANDPSPEEQANFFLDDDVSPSSPSPQLNDELAVEDGKIKLDVISITDPIIDPISDVEQSADRDPVSITDDISSPKESIDNSNLQFDGTKKSNSQSSQQRFRNSKFDVEKDSAMDKDLSKNNSDNGMERHSAMDKDLSKNNSDKVNDGYAANDGVPGEKMKNEALFDSSRESSSNETSENWLSVLQSIIPSQKERLDFNEKMLQSIRNTVSNSNVNHNAMNNAPVVPCSHSAPPSSSESPADVPADEFDLPEKYTDFEIEPKSSHIDYTYDKRHSAPSPDQFVDPLFGWDVQPVETQYTPIIHIRGEIVIRGQSQPMRLSRKCRKISVKPKQICKKGEATCHTIWSGCKSICKPGKVVCRESLSQRLKVKLVCEETWQPIFWPRIIFPARSYKTSDYELFDEQSSPYRELEQGLLASESRDCEHEVPEFEILPSAESLAEVLEPLSAIEDGVAEVDENSEVSEQVFEEAIRNAISEEPEILAPEPIGDLETEIVRDLEPAPAPSATEEAVKVAKPPRNLIKQKAPTTNVDQSRNADAKIEKLPLETSSKAIIDKETKTHGGLEEIIDSGNGNANHNVNMDVNLNQNVNSNANIAAQEPILPDIQIPILSPIIKPPIQIESRKDNANTNKNANVDMNLNINHNHDDIVNHNKQLSTQSIVEPELEKATKIPKVEPIMPTFEYEAAAKSGLDIADVNQNEDININNNITLNRNGGIDNEIGIPREPKIAIPKVKVIPQFQQPTDSQPTLKETSEPTARNVQQNVNTNVNNNVNMNHNSNVDSNVHKLGTPDVRDPEDAGIDRNPIMLPDIVLPSIKQENQNADVNADVNLNVNNNMNKSIYENTEPVISKFAERVPITIPELIQVADPPVEVPAPVHEPPLLPPLPSSSSLNINSTVNRNLNSNVNFNIINKRYENVIQELSQTPINEPEPAPTPIEETQKLISVPDVTDSTDISIQKNKNVNENSHSSVNINGNKNLNQESTNQPTQVLPEVLPVRPAILPTRINSDPFMVNEDAKENSNMNHNINSNGNVNNNYNSAVDVPETTSPGAPAIISVPRPVAVITEHTFPEVFPIAPISYQVSHNHNINSNVNYNSNINNNVNHKIAEASEQPVPTVIKPVESQPVAVPKHSEISSPTPIQTEINQDLNENANVNSNVNINKNFNTNDNVTRNANYDINAKEMEEKMKKEKESVVVPTSPDPAATQIPTLEVNVNENVPTSGERENEITEMNKNLTVNTNLNYNSNVHVSHNSDLHEKTNIKGQETSLLPSPASAPVIHEPIVLPPQAQTTIPRASIAEPGIIPSAKSNVNYNANVNVNRNLNSNGNYNQNGQMREQEPMLFPPLAPWIQQPALQPQIIPAIGLNLIHNTETNLNRNLNTNLNQSVNLKQYQNPIVTAREQGMLPAPEKHFNKNNYPPIFRPDVREFFTTAAPTRIIEDEKASVSQVTRNSQVNVNRNANVNMNYNSNYNNDANYKGKEVRNENEKGKLPLVKPSDNVLPPVIASQLLDRGTEAWNIQKNSNVNANYNSNMNYTANVNANSNYNSNLGQSGLGILTPGTGGARESSPGVQSPAFDETPALSTPIIPNTAVNGASANPAQIGYNAQQNVNTDTNYNSNLYYNSNYNHNADYNAQITSDQKDQKKKGWYELWYNNGEEKDGWTEIWNNKQFKRFLEQQLRDMKEQEDVQAQIHSDSASHPNTSSPCC